MIISSHYAVAARTAHAWARLLAILAYLNERVAPEHQGLLWDATREYLMRDDNDSEKSKGTP